MKDISPAPQAAQPVAGSHLVRRPWGVFYLKNKITGEQTSLKTSNKQEA